MASVDYSLYQTWPTPEQESPFRSELVPSDLAVSDSHTLRVFADDDRYVVRLVMSAQLASSPTLLSGTARLRAHLVGAGLHIPWHAYVVGSRHTDGRPQAFVIAERVDGQTLTDAVADDPDSVAAADEVCTCLLNFYSQRFTAGGAFPGDLKADQFLWGSTESSGQAAYMVDLDVGFGVLEPRTEQPRVLASLHWAISHVINTIADVEQHSGQRLPAARSAAETNFETCFASNGVAHRVDRLRVVLTTGEPFDGAEFFDELSQE